MLEPLILLNELDTTKSLNFSQKKIAEYYIPENIWEETLKFSRSLTAINTLHFICLTFTTSNFDVLNKLR